MKILIRGCNNHKCGWFSEGKCELPSGGISGAGMYEVIHEFDYDHVTGKLACVNCLIGDD